MDKIDELLGMIDKEGRDGYIRKWDSVPDFPINEMSDRICDLDQVALTSIFENEDMCRQSSLNEIWKNTIGGIRRPIGPVGIIPIGNLFV